MAMDDRARRMLSKPPVSSLKQIIPLRDRHCELYTEIMGNPSDEAILLLAGSGQSCLYWPDQLCMKLAQHGYSIIHFVSNYFVTQVGDILVSFLQEHRGEF